MPKPRLARAITGSCRYIEACNRFEYNTLVYDAEQLITTLKHRLASLA